MGSAVFLLIGGVVLLLIAGGLIFFGRRTQHSVNVLRRAIPTRAADVPNAFPGELVSVSGTARNDRDHISQHTKKPCVYYSFSVVREYERTNRDSKGNRTTSRSSETIASHESSVPFFVEDQTGRVRVIPDRARFDGRQVLNHYEPYAGDTSTISFGGFTMNIGMGGDRTLGHRYTESIIAADEPVFVMGVVDEHGLIGAPEPGGGTKDRALVISYRTADALREEWQSRARWMAYGAIALVVLAVVCWVAAIVSALL
jgi:hypothetical protein